MMLGVTALDLCCWIASAHADSRSDAIETGRLLAMLVDSGRLTIASHQALINDPEMDHIGLTGDVFPRQSFAAFQMRTGIDLMQLHQPRVPAMTKPLLGRRFWGRHQCHTRSQVGRTRSITSMAAAARTYAQYGLV